jgi:hypothetical protein
MYLIVSNLSIYLPNLSIYLSLSLSYLFIYPVHGLERRPGNHSLVGEPTKSWHTYIRYSESESKHGKWLFLNTWMWRLKRHRERFFTSGNPNKHGRGTSPHFYFFLRVWDSLGTFQPRFIAGSGRVCGIEPCKSQPFCSLAMFFLQPMFPFLPSFKKCGQAALSPELLDGYIYI